jgi:hypothetical protein
MTKLVHFLGKNYDLNFGLKMNYFVLNLGEMMKKIRVKTLVNLNYPVMPAIMMLDSMGWSYKDPACWTLGEKCGREEGGVFEDVRGGEGRF